MKLYLWGWIFWHSQNYEIVWINVENDTITLKPRQYMKRAIKDDHKSKSTEWVVEYSRDYVLKNFEPTNQSFIDKFLSS